MVMVIIGILAAVSVPRFANVVRQSEAASEQGILVNLVAALDTYSQEQFIDNGVMSWPDNPFDALNKVPASYDKTQSTLMVEMDDSDWIFTGDKQVMIIKTQSFIVEKKIVLQYGLTINPTEKLDIPILLTSQIKLYTDLICKDNK